MESASIDEAEAAKRGPQGHWAMFDESLECARWDGLHRVIATAPFDQVRACALMRELEDAAFGYGYGSEDSFRYAMAHNDPESPESVALQETHENPQDSDQYYAAIDRSVTLLMDAAATPDARGFVSGIAMTLQDAAQRGRDDRARMDDVAPGGFKP